MKFWLLVYVIDGVVHVCPIRTLSFADAATLEDDVAETFRRRGLRAEWLQVTGPYAGVKIAGVPVDPGDVDAAVWNNGQTRQPADST